MLSRSALHVTCTVAEAATIRLQAKNERRSMSAYVLQLVMAVVPLEERFGGFASNRRPTRVRTGRRTSLLIRCSSEEAKRIRSAASLRQMTISSFVLDHVKRSWKARGIKP
jgi:hypothetical protein